MSITTTAPKMLKKIIIPFAVIGLLIVLALSLSHKTLAPNVTFTMIDGKKITLSSLKGKVVLINFWATDCPGCIQEMPALIETYKKFQSKGLEIIAVAMPYDPPAQVLNYTKMKALPFPVMHDGFGDIVNKFDHVTLTPTAFIYNKQGELIRHTIGDLDFPKLNQLLSKELAVN